MSVVIETTLGDITVDLYINRRPRACANFLKLCKIKYYNFNLFHTVSRGFIAQTGDPTGSRNGGESIFGVLEGPLKRYFEPETNPRIKHTTMGLISFVGNENNMVGSQFFFTLGTDLTYLDEKHCVFGEVVEGLDVLEVMNEAICDNDDRPYQDIRITHTVILEDPFPDGEKLRIPSRSPSPSAERLQGGRIAPDEEVDETAGKTAGEVSEMIAEREAKARATILEMVGDIPDAEMAPPENVLFVCKLNPVTCDDDLEIIFSRFGKIKSCEVIRDRKTGDSLQYAFVEFEDQKSCEDAYFKMDNVLIDDRRIHVDFSQSVSKIRWLGKGRGVKNYGENDKDLGKGQYQKNGSRKNYNPGDTYKGKDRKPPERRREDKSKDYRPSNKEYSRKNKDDDRSREYRDRDKVYQRRNQDDRRDRHRSNPDRYYDYKRRGRSRSPKYRSSEKKDEDRRKTVQKFETKKKRDPSSSSESEKETRKKSHKDKTKSKKKKREETSSSESEHEKRKKKKSKKKKKSRSSSDSS